MGKLIVIVVLVIALLVGLAKLGIIPVDLGSSAAAAKTPAAEQQAQQQPQPAPVAAAGQQEPLRPAAAEAEKGAIQSTLEYGAGYTQFKAMQYSRKKLDALNKKNQDRISKQ